ncbi:nucleoside hydrolase [Aestuariivirga litoralis]|uniref:nucleoside hydrolase n=1 Tax=Aestuariivirga litoralis TaxID=2650924 RepID=UPI0018C60ACF|nr:nucleoside hydrolase [Aestuariivirga litoralis]MBG1231223.1 nucleoside hydrolase [Aestuariivirga litoralis]
MAQHHIIIDTDPGQDDALAIFLALASPEIEVLGICAVAGNVPLPLTEVNTRKICELAGKPDVKVYAGAERPLLRPLVTAEHVHGKTGLDGPVLPDPKMQLQKQYAVDFIIDTLMNRPAGTVTLCVLGPMTNIALALIKEPRIASRIKRIIAMGGGFSEGGNITPAAEFNIYVDPHAARVVFESGTPITLVPLDCTHQALSKKTHIERFRTMKNKTGPAVAEMLDFFERFDVDKYGSEGAPLHDPCVIAWLLHPEFFTGKDCNVAIECESELTMGMTVVDWWRVTKRPHNAHVVRGINADSFFNLLIERLAKLA